MYFRFYRMVFGIAPQLLHKYMRNIDTINLKKGYVTNNRNSAYIVNSFIPSKQLLPMGNYFDFTQYLNQNSNSVKTISQSALDNHNPFLCGIRCASTNGCDIF